MFLHYVLSGDTHLRAFPIYWSRVLEGPVPELSETFLSFAFFLDVRQIKMDSLTSSDLSLEGSLLYFFEAMEMSEPPLIHEGSHIPAMPARLQASLESPSVSKCSVL